MNWMEPTEDDVASRNAWLNDSEHAPVRDVAQRFEPWAMYKLTTTGQRCRVLTAGECGRLRVYAEHPTLGGISGTQVVGIDPDDLVPWEPCADDDERPMTKSNGFGPFSHRFDHLPPRDYGHWTVTGIVRNGISVAREREPEFRCVRLPFDTAKAACICGWAGEATSAKSTAELFAVARLAHSRCEPKPSPYADPAQIRVSIGPWHPWS